MNTPGTEILWLLVLVGAVSVLSVFVKHWFEKIGLPSLVAYLLLGVGLAWCDETWHWITRTMEVELELLAQLGLVCLLFRVGLDSDITGLIDQLGHAVWVWVGNVLVAVAVGYITCFYLLELAWIPSVIVAVAFSATSVGVTSSVWEETGQLDSDDGELFVDVAELDDLSAVVLMGMLFVLLPELKNGGNIELFSVLHLLGEFLFGAVLFGGLCVLFSSYFEKPLSSCVSEIRPNIGPLMTMVGVGFIIAAIAGLLDFSLAIGALFAGIVFSRDPVMIREEANFQILYELFTPFFFIVIGLDVSLNFSTEILIIGGSLLVAAIAGKYAGAGLPAYLIGGKTTGRRLGVSMIPRAEITLIIMKRGLEQGAWALPETIYSGMVIVSMGTCILGAIWLRPLLAEHNTNP